ncbi:MAG: MFS transporter [Eubacteriales bacterium]|nr:MFS transporter [Eubacteriales bacterium]
MKKRSYKELRIFFILWGTQALSQLGSSMTSFALTLWLYQKTGSALETALLSICSYTPYVLMSIFAGALSDRWDKKKVMLVCDTLAACCTVTVFLLLKRDLLCLWHLYLLNALNGLMNTVQQPASDVAMTLIIPKKYYQKTSGMRSFSQSLVTVLNPILATAAFSLWGMDAVIRIDLGTFGIAFLALLFFVRIPKVRGEETKEKEPLLRAAKSGLVFLKENPLLLLLIGFLSGVNLIASAFDATLPAYILPLPNGGETVLGMVSSAAGIATMLGSVLVTFLPRPKNRVRVIYWTMLFSLSIENFLLAFSRSPALWCLGQFIGWSVVPVMNANLDVILRSSIPVEMQGRVYSCRNTLQFFTIPVGFFLGGFLVDEVCEPILAGAADGGMLQRLFGVGKGSGAAMMMFLLGIAGTLFCLGFGRLLEKYRYEDEAVEKE